MNKSLIQSYKDIEMFDNNIRSEQGSSDSKQKQKKTIKFDETVTHRQYEENPNQFKITPSIIHKPAGSMSLSQQLMNHLSSDLQNLKTNFPRQNSPRKSHIVQSQKMTASPRQSVTQKNITSPNQSQNLRDNPFNKHRLLNLRQKLDTFIIEEKEKTMMNRSQIPDPHELDDQLEDINEEQSYSQNHIKEYSNVQNDQNFNSPTLKFIRSQKIFQKASPQAVKPLSIDKNQITRLQLTEEDQDLIYLLKKNIALANERTSFMRDLQKVMDRYERKSPISLSRQHSKQVSEDLNFNLRVTSPTTSYVVRQRETKYQSTSHQPINLMNQTQSVNKKNIDEIHYEEPPQPHRISQCLNIKRPIEEELQLFQSLSHIYAIVDIKTVSSLWEDLQPILFQQIDIDDFMFIIDQIKDQIYRNNFQKKQMLSMKKLLKVDVSQLNNHGEALYQLLQSFYEFMNFMKNLYSIKEQEQLQQQETQKDYSFQHGGLAQMRNYDNQQQKIPTLAKPAQKDLRSNNQTPVRQKYDQYHNVLNSAARNRSQSARQQQQYMQNDQNKAEKQQKQPIQNQTNGNLKKYLSGQNANQALVQTQNKITINNTNSRLGSPTANFLSSRKTSTRESVTLVNGFQQNISASTATKNSQSIRNYASPQSMKQRFKF
eukprot:403358697